MTIRVRRFTFRHFSFPPIDRSEKETQIIDCTIAGNLSPR